jgi:hypothetical protein
MNEKEARYQGVGGGYNRLPKGGHLAAREQPELFTANCGPPPFLPSDRP